MENMFIFIGIIVAIVAIVGGIMWYMHRQNNPKADKKTDKNAYLKNTLRVLKKFALDYNYTVTSPAHIKVKDKQADLDALVVGYFGVFGVISLGYNGEIYGNRNDQDWLQVAPDGTRTYFKNPLVLADEYVRIVRQTLFNNGMKQIPVEVAVVFASSNVSIAVSKDVNYFTPKTLSKHLAKEKYGQDKKFDLDAAKKSILEHTIKN